jgi:hypothetical protein
MVSANNVGGMIKGQVSVARANKSYKFEIKPSLTNRFGEMIISKELEKL